MFLSHVSRSFAGSVSEVVVLHVLAVHLQHVLRELVLTLCVDVALHLVTVRSLVQRLREKNMKLKCNQERSCDRKINKLTKNTSTWRKMV